MYRNLVEATRLTRAGQVANATALLLRTLRGRTTTVDVHNEPASNSSAETASGSTDFAPPTVEAQELRPAPRIAPSFGRHTDEPTGRGATPRGLNSFLKRVVPPRPDMLRSGLVRPSPLERPRVPDGARFIESVYSDGLGQRDYKLYIPSGDQGQTRPLIVMLHGCTQTPDDFAAGTCMNEVAEEHDFLVVYPAQSISANSSKCWNWFNPRDQRRGQGEPALIAGITRQVMRDYAVDERRVYVAGLSAGGAAAAIMSKAYPDLYAAVGVHSGLACGAASDLPSAFAAMRGGNNLSSWATPDANTRIVPTIVFHGDQDATVSPCNGDQVIAQSRGATATMEWTSVQNAQVPRGHAYSRMLYANADGRSILEQWIIRGAGHAWSGGSPAGSYTDPRGPDASREMVRFFLEHSRPESDASLHFIRPPKALGL
jgi:poly(hydroxyalkanoate) depolymerase family esterase